MKSAHSAFRTTLDLFAAGVEMMRQNLRRDQPGASERDIDERLSQWLRERPGAASGDSPGTLVDITARIG